MSLFESTLRDLLAAGHGVRFRASGDSMAPAIRDGDDVEVVPCDPAELRRGEVVLVAAGKRLTAHRIVRISGERIVTRGDNKLHADVPVALGDVLGRVNGVETLDASAIMARFAAVLVRRLRARLQR